ncbi:MAG: aminotransferase class I/II-fold pyridoxal phosphate-dependent enzyme [Armatimonadetes bacterium]|nr:aminotransferase class I/II-fold pyridoxal phosphate-dependent enzyme [Armatimonadota bacterium]
MKAISKLVQEVPASGIRKFFDVVSQMEGVISLGVGEPDFVTPWHIREACIWSVEKGYTNYTSNYGLLQLREAISEYLEAAYGVSYSPRDAVLVTVGVSEGLDLALRAIINPGDEIIVVEPCYVSYKPCVSFAGGTPVAVGSDVSRDFRVTARDIEAAVTPRTKAILLSYPSNPTGAVLPCPDCLEIVEVARKHDLYMISDEIYANLTYEGEHTCFAALPGMKDRIILLNGFSKAYAMTGWRLGYAASNPQVIEAMMKIHQYTMLCAPIAAQMGAIEALKNGDAPMREMVAEYDNRRRFIVKGLNDIGLECFMPKGAFYAFPSIRRSGLSSEEFSSRLLFEEKVAVVPGDAFGECGEGHVRCAYASSIADIEEALHRMERFLRRLEKERA